MYTISFQNETIRPGKIICIARNYINHAKELNNPIPKEPIFFIKPSSSIKDTIILQNRKIRYESEISILFREDGNHGIGFGLDLTLQDVQNTLKEKGYPWEASKAFKGSAIFSKFIPLSSILTQNNEHKSSWNLNSINWKEFGIELQINDTITQKDQASSMIFPIQNIIEKSDEIFSLEENDIIMTGTPSGVGLLNEGDYLKGTVTFSSSNIIEFSVKIL